MATDNNGASVSQHIANSYPKITFYTNHICPYAQCVQITLDELNLPYTKIEIDLGVPRPPWYFDINRRGQVPTLVYTVPGQAEEIIPESATIAQFLADLRPGVFFPASKEGALERARISLFLNIWQSKVGDRVFPLFATSGAVAKNEIVAEIVQSVESEREPLLANAAPFFNRAEELTLAEAIAAPILIRLIDASEDGELVPRILAEQFDALPHFSRWTKTVRARPSVTAVYDAREVLATAMGHMAKVAAAAAVAAEK